MYIKVRQPHKCPTAPGVHFFAPKNNLDTSGSQWLYTTHVFFGVKQLMIIVETFLSGVTLAAATIIALYVRFSLLPMFLARRVCPVAISPILPILSCSPRCRSRLSSAH